MSKIIYNYLTESELFNPSNLDDNFKKYTDIEVKTALESYRNYVLANWDIIIKEIIDQSSELSVQTESLNHFLPSEQLLKQLATYMDQIIINDPVFDLTHVPSKLSDDWSELLGLNKNHVIDRNKLSESLKYMKRITPLIVNNVVKFFPISKLHEPPEHTPIYYSKNYFADVLPQKLLKWFQDNAVVLPLEKRENAWVSMKGASLNPCRGIAIHFKNDLSESSFLYFLTEVVSISHDHENKTGQMVQWLPPYPPKADLFNAWISQSINRSADDLYRSLIVELMSANSLKSQYLTTSPFISDLLNLDLSLKDNFSSDISNLILKLKMPIIENTSIEAIAKVRENEQVFNNFRIELTKQLKELRTCKTNEDLHKQLENISYEISKVYINKIANQIKTLKQNLLSNAVILVGTLSTTVFAGSWSILGALGAIAKGYKDYNKYISEIKQNPSYFLWQIDRQK